MKVVIFGATRGVGRHAVERALELGHEVTAFARDPAAMKLVHPRLRIARGDAFDARAVEEAVAGQDAVVSALGSRFPKHTDVCSAGTRNIIRAMEKHGVRRLVAVSSFGVGETRRQVPWPARPFVAAALGRAFADKEVQEREIRASRVDWVIVQPVFLTNGAARGGVRAWTDARRTGSWFVSRADVADFVLAQLASDAFVGKAPAIGGAAA
jgi:putative NADH-flavin reductase